ncbi:tyrosine-type recombinase/integrase [Streptomyces sp. cg28]|uniref:tyrosine-type recombinase/integrase n=1 Tax=Streptomyces sp. cg28 TaxID=3403457 RepID=UPI003B21817F
MKGSTYRRCYCRDENGKALGKSCPQLSSRRHGVWALRQELPLRGDGTRRSFSRSGYDGAKAAEGDLTKVRALLDLPDGDDREAQVLVGDLLEAVSGKSKAPLPDLAETRRRLVRGQKLTATMTVGDLLDEWLDVKRKSRRDTTLDGYESHVRVHLRPGLGEIRLERLGVGHCQSFFDGIEDRNDVIRAENLARAEQADRTKWGKGGRPPASERERLAAERAKLAEMPPFRKLTGLSSKHAIRRTLRTALNFAIGREYVTFNPARHVELTPSPRPTGLLWTDERVSRWQETGEVPSPVMVWTPAQIGRFLDEADGHRLYAFYHLLNHHGLRRGEGVGQAWEDAHLDATPPRIEVRKEIVVSRGKVIETAPKTDLSAAAVTIDRETVDVLREHRRQQLAERDAWNAHAAEQRAAGIPTAGWADTGKMFANPDGTWLHPDEVSREFHRIRERAGLPPVNLRDTRHGAAALVKAGGGDIDDAGKKLRHSTIVLTADTYMALFQEYEQDLAERSAAAVPRARKPAADTPAHAPLTQDPGDDDAP